MIWLIPFLLAGAAPSDAQGSTRGLYLQLIHQARADGRARAAIAYLDDFDRRYPGDVDAQVLRVNSLLDLNDLKAAEAVAAAMPNGGGSALRGHLLAARADWANATAFYQQATKDSPADPMLRNALGYAQLRAGMVDQAIESLRAGLDLAPGERTIRNNLLLALRTAGREPQADAIINAVHDVRERDELRRHLANEFDNLSAGKDR